MIPFKRTGSQTQSRDISEISGSHRIVGDGDLISLGRPAVDNSELVVGLALLLALGVRLNSLQTPRGQAQQHIDEGQHFRKSQRQKESCRKLGADLEGGEISKDS